MNDESERKARAERLRKQIGSLTHKAPDDAGKPAPAPAPAPESAADFVHRRMREIDQEKERK
jgi:hypothetical protein